VPAPSSSAPADAATLADQSTEKRAGVLAAPFLHLVRLSIDDLWMSESRTFRV
jgi:hypothetical protein